MDLKWIFNSMLSFNKFWNTKSIIRMNQNLMEFILEIICLIIKDGAYVINLYEYADAETHWISLCISNNDAIYFGSFGVEHITKPIKKFIWNRNIKTNTFRIQANNSIVCGYFCMGFIDFMLAGKTLIGYASLCLPYHFERHDEIILSHFQSEWSTYFSFKFKKSDTIKIKQNQ